MGLPLWRRNDASKSAAVPEQASADHILTACKEAGVSFIAKDMIDLGPSRESFDSMMGQVQGIQDRCAAFSMDDPKAGRQLAETFMQKIFVENDWPAAVGALLTDAQAVAAGEEIDHHQPPEQASRMSGGINPFDLYKQENTR